MGEVVDDEEYEDDPEGYWSNKPAGWDKWHSPEAKARRKAAREAANRKENPISRWGAMKMEHLEPKEDEKAEEEKEEEEEQEEEKKAEEPKKTEASKERSGDEEEDVLDEDPEGYWSNKPAGWYKWHKPKAEAEDEEPKKKKRRRKKRRPKP